MLLVDDRKLLDGFRAGHPDALLAVYRRYAPPVAGLLRRGFSFRSQGRTCRFHGTRSTFDLEDRVQEVFTRAFSERARLAYDGLSSYEAYLLTIAKNLIVDDFRKKARALTDYSMQAAESADEGALAAGSEPLHGHLVPTGDPSEDVGRVELLRLVSEFEAGLSERERSIYQLRFKDELEHREISERTGLSPSKIKTSERRIRVRFFGFMQDRGYFAGYEQTERSGWIRWVRRLGGGTP